MLTRLVSVIAFAAPLFAGASAHAAITVYTSQAAFLGSVTAPGDDTFDDLHTGFLPDTLYRHAGPYTYQAYSGGGLYGAGGAGGDVWLSNNYQNNPIVFSNFSGGVEAFGGFFFPTDFAGNATSGDVVLTAIDGTVITYNLTAATPGTFLGFVSDTPLSSVILGASGGYWPTANDVVLAVPEPAAYGMLLTGLGLIGWAARSRRG